MGNVSETQLIREKLVFRYSAALSRGDFESVETILEQAESDPILESMILELNLVYQQEFDQVQLPSMNTKPAASYFSRIAKNLKLERGKSKRTGATSRKSWLQRKPAWYGAALAALLVVFIASAGSFFFLRSPADSGETIFGITSIQGSRYSRQVDQPISPSSPQDYYEVNPSNQGVNPSTTSPQATSMPSYRYSAGETSPLYGGTDPVNDEPYFDVFFEEYGVNPFMDTEIDNLSTFALDVDTGSYTIMRRYLSDGNLPPSKAIRVEEFVNFFDYEYPTPARKAFALHLEGGETPFVQGERYQILRVGVQGFDVADEDRKDAVLTFVIDVSGSMSQENRLGAVKTALRSLVGNLRPTDKVGIVVYGSNAWKVLEPTSVRERDVIIDAIDSLQSEGSTYAEAGIKLGYQLANQAFEPDAINRVILCSDGVANVGNTGPEAILESIRGYADEGITLTTVGFGMGNYNDVLMEQLANNGDGFYAYVDTQKQAERLFVHDLTGTLQVIALDAKIQVDFNPEIVSLYRLIGFENRAIADEDFRDDSVDAGEIGAGHSVTALYEIKLAKEATGRIATVALRWEDPESHEVTEISETIDVSDLAEDFDETSPSFQLAVYVAQYAQILKESPWAEEFTLSGLDEWIHSFDLHQFDSVDVIEFGELVQWATMLALEN
jgi:Ca-activated chloride channel family protein